jgi:hypothetical protein
VFALISFCIYFLFAVLLVILQVAISDQLGIQGKLWVYQFVFAGKACIHVFCGASCDLMVFSFQHLASLPSALVQLQPLQELAARAAATVQLT